MSTNIGGAGWRASTSTDFQSYPLIRAERRLGGRSYPQITQISQIRREEEKKNEFEVDEVGPFVDI